MAVINSRDTLADYCKRNLGEPVIEVNIDEDSEQVNLENVNTEGARGERGYRGLTGKDGEKAVIDAYKEVDSF